MAKSSISDQLGPWLAIFRKYYFWLLAAIVPLILLPLLFIARGSMSAHIQTMRQQIDGHVTNLKAVSDTAKHPNESWSKSIKVATDEVSKETFDEWKSFWDSQEAFRIWPQEALGADFVKKVETLKPDGKLSPMFRERYKDKVRTLVRELLVRMGVEPRMGEERTDAPQARVAPRRQPVMRPGMMQDENAVEPSPYTMEWNPENQQRIYASFNWEGETPPSPTKILLAQEELWVYRMFCDLLAGANKGATGPHSAAIAKVELLFVGYPAAEDDPGGAAGKRVFRVAASAPETAGMGQSPSAPALSPLVRPANPRFSGPAVSLIFSAAGSQYAYDEDAAPPPASSQASASQAAAPSNPDEELKNWVYVDFTGKPLTAAELSAASDSLMVHRMPFVMRVIIDQRQIDPLLVGLSTAPVPIDVRQVRINASGSPVADPTSGDAARPMADEGAGFGSGSGSGSGRIYDVSLELRGTVELATPPSKKAVGLDSAESGDKAAATPEAAMSAPAALRRTAS